MKFLLEFVTCCGSHGSRDSPMQPSSPPEESRSLVTENLRSFRRKRVKVVKSRGASALAEWHPSLVSISEDGGIMERESLPIAAEKKAKRRSESTGKVHHGRNYRDKNHPTSRSRWPCGCSLPTKAPKAVSRITQNVQNVEIVLSPMKPRCDEC